MWLAQALTVALSLKKQASIYKARPWLGAHTYQSTKCTEHKTIMCAQFMRSGYFIKSITSHGLNLEAAPVQKTSNHAFNLGAVPVQKPQKGKQSLLLSVLLLSICVCALLCVSSAPHLLCAAIVCLLLPCHVFALLALSVILDAPGLQHSLKALQLLIALLNVSGQLLHALHHGPRKFLHHGDMLNSKSPC